jgi:hypothetical protein
MKRPEQLFRQLVAAPARGRQAQATFRGAEQIHQPAKWLDDVRLRQSRHEAPGVARFIAQAGLHRHRDRRDAAHPAHALVEELLTLADGSFGPVTEGLTMPVTRRVTHAGIVTVTEFDLRMP